MEKTSAVRESRFPTLISPKVCEVKDGLPGAFSCAGTQAGSSNEGDGVLRQA